MLIYYAFTAAQLINMYNIKSNLYADDDAILCIDVGIRIPYCIINLIQKSGVFRLIIVVNAAL